MKKELLFMLCSFRQFAVIIFFFCAIHLFATDYDAAGIKDSGNDVLSASVKNRDVFVTEVNKNISLKLKKRTAGIYKIKIAFIYGAAYSIPKIKIDGISVKNNTSLIATTSLRSGKIEVLTSLLDSGLHKLEIAPEQNKKLAIEYVDYQLDASCFKAVDYKLWKMLTKQGTTSAITYLHRPIPWSHYQLKLQADGPAELFVNGMSMGKTSLTKPMLDAAVNWGEVSKYTAICIRVKMPANKNIAFKLFCSPLSGGSFMRDVPDFISENKANDDWPRHQISNDIVSVVIALPDIERGFYRGMRFERAGIITALRYRGHNYFARNFTKENRNPVIHDHVSGQAEEFSRPLGYSEAEVGGAFLKLGVGLLEKPFYPIYAWRVPYKAVKIFPWTSKLYSNHVEFIQKGKLDKYSYTYTKNIGLKANKAVLIINYDLKNTGTKTIKTSQYAHNFIAIDDNAVGKDYQVDLGFKAKTKFGENLPPGLEVKGHSVFINSVKKPCLIRLNGASMPGNNWVKVQHLPSETAIKIHGNFKSELFQLYITKIYICPELFISLDVKPGESVKWTRSYVLF